MLCSGDFSPFDLDVSDLIQCVCLVFEQVLALPELSSYSISKGKKHILWLTINSLWKILIYWPVHTVCWRLDNLYDLFLDIYRSYHDNNPYHNFSHAVDVLQTTYYYLCQIGVLELMLPSAKRARSRPACVHQLPVRDIIRPCDIFALLMASIGHDVGHPGVNNMFLVSRSATSFFIFLLRAWLSLRQHPANMSFVRSFPDQYWYAIGITIQWSLSAGKFSYHGVIPYLEKAWYRSSAWWAEINNLCWLVF